MPKLTNHCPQCGKVLVLDREILLDPSDPKQSKKLNLYKCGHLFAKTLHKFDKSELDLDSTDGQRHARAYQADGVEFILNSNFNCIIGDQMRLGKTPQSLLALKNAYTLDRLPCLIIVRGANLWQWIREYKVWCDILPNGIYPIVGGKAFIPPGFSSYIISMDTFSLGGTCKTCGHAAGRHLDSEGTCKAKNCAKHCKSFVSAGDSMADRLSELNFKLVIVDEAHSFKNTTSNRSQALVDFISRANTFEDTENSINLKCFYCKYAWTETVKIKYDKFKTTSEVNHYSKCPQCGSQTYAAARKQEIKRENKCGLILLTGTAIKNRAEEYFVPLNLVAPEKFASLERFRREWLEQDHKGRWSRVKSYKFQEFKETIKPYVLRREKEDVFTDLPPLNRIFTVIEPDKDALSEQYNKILDKLESKLAEKANPTYWDMADDLMELRRICGMMKVMWASDYVESCLADSENQKYAIGIHHKSVRDVLYMKLGMEANCVKLSGEDSAERKDSIMRRFETSQERVLIINMLAGGVGMDFHYVDNVLILERQWSSADEEQFEFRFFNPDLKIKNRATNIEYIVAKGTIDEFFYDLIEEKRKIFGETISNNWSMTSDSSSFKQLVERAVASRL